MSTSYKTICTLNLEHRYYTKGFRNDFRIVPLPQTQKLAAQYKLLFRQNHNKFEILSQMINETTPRVDLGDTNKLSFALILTNKSLINYTRLREKLTSNQIYQLNNMSARNAIISTRTWQITTPKLPIIPYSIQSNSQSVTLEFTNPFGEKFSLDTINSDGHHTTQIDLTGQVEGLYSINVMGDGQKLQEEKIYVSELLWQTRPFAIVDVFSEELNYQNAKEYTISFAPKKAVWTYLVNLTKDYTGSQISIEDSRETPEILFKLEGNTDQSEGKTLSFSSYKANAPQEQALIKSRETPLTDFNLIIEKNGNKTEIKGLANPSVNQIKTEMHINI